MGLDMGAGQTTAISRAEPLPEQALQPWYLLATAEGERLVFGQQALWEAPAQIHPDDYALLPPFFAAARAWRAGLPAPRLLLRLHCPRLRCYRLTALSAEPAQVLPLEGVPMPMSVLSAGLMRPLDTALRELRDTLEQVEIFPLAAWRTVMERGPDGAMQAGTVQVSRSWARMLGRELEELGAFRHSDWAALTHPDDVASFEAAYARLQSGETVKALTRSRHKAGHWVHFYSFCRVTRWTEAGEIAFVDGFDLDLSEQARLEAELAEEHARLTAVMEATPVGQIVVGASGLIEFANDTACKKLRHGRAAVLGAPFCPLMQKMLNAPDLAGHLADPDPEAALHITTEEREPREIQIRVSPLAGDRRLITLLNVTELTHLRARLEQSIDHARYIATHDLMTGLPDRYYMLRRLNNALEEARANGSGLAVIYVDVDNFKQVNDTLGHEAGDQLIKAVAARLRKYLPPSGIMARMGGDEFVLVLPDADRLGADKLAHAILGNFARPWAFGPRQTHLTASLGLALFPQHGASAEELLRHADMAMYQSKAGGRNALTWFSGEIRARNERRAIVVEALREALDHGRLRLNLQPKFSVESAEVALCGAEVLLRLTDPALGPISPGEFIPAAESAGLMPAIDFTVAGLAADLLRDWRGRGLSLPLAVNLSTATLDNPALPDLAEHLVALGLAPEHVRLELTETGLAASLERRSQALFRLAEAGYQIAVDDFGTGQSALSMLQSLPLSELKIDQSFIRRIDATENPARSVALVRAILAMARALELPVVAEGVETEVQLAFLRAEGCATVQGYLFSPPMEIDQFEARFMAPLSQDMTKKVPQ